MYVTIDPPSVKAAVLCENCHSRFTQC